MKRKSLADTKKNKGEKEKSVSVKTALSDKLVVNRMLEVLHPEIILSPQDKSAFNSVQ